MEWNSLCVAIVLNNQWYCRRDGWSITILFYGWRYFVEAFFFIEEHKNCIIPHHPVGSSFFAFMLNNNHKMRTKNATLSERFENVIENITETAEKSKPLKHINTKTTHFPCVVHVHTLWLKKITEFIYDRSYCQKLCFIYSVVSTTISIKTQRSYL